MRFPPATGVRLSLESLTEPIRKGVERICGSPVVLARSQGGGYLTERSLRPPAPGIPTVREFQTAQGEFARNWLAGLL